MRGEKKPLYRTYNKLARGFHNNDPGGNYRHERNTKKAKNFEGSRKSIGYTRTGYDYTPLYMFLLSKVGQKWDEVYSEAVSRLDKDDAVWHMVDLNVDENSREIVWMGESSMYSALTVRNGRLEKINPNAEPWGASCSCCTFTFNGKQITKKSEHLLEQEERYREWQKEKKERIIPDYDMILKCRKKKDEITESQE